MNAPITHWPDAIVDGLIEQVRHLSQSQLDQLLFRLEVERQEREFANRRGSLAFIDRIISTIQHDHANRYGPSCVILFRGTEAVCVTVDSTGAELSARGKTVPATIEAIDEALTPLEAPCPT